MSIDLKPYDYQRDRVLRCIAKQCSPTSTRAWSAHL